MFRQDPGMTSDPSDDGVANGDRESCSGTAAPAHTRTAVLQCDISSVNMISVLCVVCT